MSWFVCRHEGACRAPQSPCQTTCLIESDDDWHAGRLGVADGLDGLRPHAVIGGHHDDGDVRDFGAARTHCAERLQQAQHSTNVRTEAEATLPAIMCMPDRIFNLI